MRICCALLLCASIAQAGDRPLPDDAAINAAAKLVLETYSDELGSEDGLRSLLKTADKITDDDAGQVAIYIGVQKRATALGVYRLGFVAIDRMAARYDVDAPSLKLDYLDSIAKAAKTPQQRASVVNQAMELADERMAAGDAERAEKAIKVASTAVGKTRDAALRKEVAAKRREIEKAAKEREHAGKELDRALDRLKSRPNDPEDNELVGLAMARQGDWKMAPVFLKNSKSAALRRAAEADIAGAESSADQAKIGDLWWAAGKDFRGRAAFWYTRALDGATGIAKARLEKRIAEAGEVATGESGAGGKTADIVLAPGVVLKLVKIPASADGKVGAFWLGQTEVTQQQWQAVMGNNPSVQAKSDQLPVHNIGFDSAKEFCEKLSEISVRFHCRLPERDEWFHAFEANSPESTATLYWPKSNDYAWTKENAGGKYDYHPVASLKPNPWGLYDMQGNCWEWLADGKTYGMCSFDDCTKQQVEAFIVRHEPFGTVKKEHWAGITVRVAADPR